MRLLVPLARMGRAPQARLAELPEIEPISVSHLLDRMEQAGWVLREADPKVRRVLTSYIVAVAIMTPVTGWLANRVGNRKSKPRAPIGVPAPLAPAD
jgi:hypothetical protein